MGEDAGIDSASWRGMDGWIAYFGDLGPEGEESAEFIAKQVVVDRLQTFFLEPGWRFLKDIEEYDRSFHLDFNDFVSESPMRSIEKAIVDSPEDSLPCIALAAARALESQGVFCERKPQSPIELLVPRFTGISNLTGMKDLNSASIGKFLSVQGHVVRVGNVRQQVKSLVFSCCKCGKEFTQGFKDFKYASPMECPNAPTCRGHFFRPMTSSAVTCDWQGIRIQENLRDDVREVGRMPRTLDIELVSDLIDSCNPGDTVTICGVSKALNVEAGNNAGGRASKAKTHSLFKLYIDANSVVSSGRSRKRRRKATDDDITDEDLTAFEEISGDLNTFELLAHSICPSIYGHELVKAGILLTLLGGSQKPETTEVCVRPDIHCLIVGDPGLGKSQLLKATTNVAPRGIYVCGNTSTTAGLTVTMVKESGSNDYFLEAGALVLGDEGICCIDEFDKMGSEHQALLEAMEQQTVSIAKAGMICNLKTKTSVVAAANPRGGHYDLSKTVCENLKIALPLLSRFDLVFILLDSPDKQKDRYISEHVLTACTSKKKKKGSVHRRPRSRETDAVSEAERISLEKRLQKYRCDSPLPSVLFRKYISYARAHINPILSNSAKRVLQTFYLTLRRGMGNQTLDVPPVTTRQLESLKRLVEARAKAEHRQIATENDALDVIEILKASLVDTFSDEHGRIDFTRASGMSRTKEVKKFVMGLHAEAQRTGHDVFSMSDLKRIAQNLQLKIPMFEDFIDMINHQNVLLKRSKGYRLQGTQLG